MTSCRPPERTAPLGLACQQRLGVRLKHGLHQLGRLDDDPPFAGAELEREHVAIGATALVEKAARVGHVSKELHR